jgi:F0F1-type ATP synthase membrane subunit b/b'
LTSRYWLCGYLPLENLSPNNFVNTSANGEYYQAPASERFSIQQELDRIEEIVLESPRVPLSGKTMVSEDELLDQLDVVRVNLPAAVQESVQIVQQREEILTEAEQYAQEIITSAEKQAAAILNEMTIIRQAESQAAQLRAQTEQECAALRGQTLSEIEQLQTQARKEWEEMRTRTTNEAKTIQEDADTYADQVLENMERQFTEMLHILRNGRQQIQGGQSLDTETTTPRAQINPTTGTARPVTRREATPISPLPERPPLQRNPGARS